LEENNFISCLAQTEQTDEMLSPVAPTNSTINYLSPRSISLVILKRALSTNEVGDESWLSSSFIDLVLSKFARFYGNVRYLSADFGMLSKSSFHNADFEGITDINGRLLDYSDTKTPIVFIVNARNIHWNLIRVVRHPFPELQLFEPLGMPLHRHGGLNFRSVPKTIIDWLDFCCPLLSKKSWIKIGRSAIVNQQQINSFDCGVACLLYAEKCGQGEVIHDYKYI
jgi:hypothetical protein